MLSSLDGLALQTRLSIPIDRDRLLKLIEDARSQVDDKLHSLMESYLRLAHYEQQLKELDSNEQQLLCDSKT